MTWKADRVAAHDTEKSLLTRGLADQGVKIIFMWHGWTLSQGNLETSLLQSIQEAVRIANIYPLLLSIEHGASE